MIIKNYYGIHPGLCFLADTDNKVKVIALKKLREYWYDLCTTDPVLNTNEITLSEISKYENLWTFLSARITSSYDAQSVLPLGEAQKEQIINSALLLFSGSKDEQETFVKICRILCNATRQYIAKERMIQIHPSMNRIGLYTAGLVPGKNVLSMDELIRHIIIWPEIRLNANNIEKNQPEFYKGLCKYAIKIRQHVKDQHRDDRLVAHLPGFLYELVAPYSLMFCKAINKAEYDVEYLLSSHIYLNNVPKVKSKINGIRAVKKDKIRGYDTKLLATIYLESLELKLNALDKLLAGATENFKPPQSPSIDLENGSETSAPDADKLPAFMRSAKSTSGLRRQPNKRNKKVLSSDLCKSNDYELIKELLKRGQTLSKSFKKFLVSRTKYDIKQQRFQNSGSKVDEKRLIYSDIYNSIFKKSKTTVIKSDANIVLAIDISGSLDAYQLRAIQIAASAIVMLNQNLGSLTIAAYNSGDTSDDPIVRWMHPPNTKNNKQHSDAIAIIASLRSSGANHDVPSFKTIVKACSAKYKSYNLFVLSDGKFNTCSPTISGEEEVSHFFIELKKQKGVKATFLGFGADPAVCNMLSKIIQVVNIELNQGTSDIDNAIVSAIAKSI